MGRDLSEWVPEARRRWWSGVSTDLGTSSEATDHLNWVQRRGGRHWESVRTDLLRRPGHKVATACHIGLGFGFESPCGHVATSDYAVLDMGRGRVVHCLRARCYGARLSGAPGRTPWDGKPPIATLVSEGARPLGPLTGRHPRLREPYESCAVARLATVMVAPLTGSRSAARRGTCPGK